MMVMARSPSWTMSRWVLASRRRHGGFSAPDTAYLHSPPDLAAAGGYLLAAYGGLFAHRAGPSPATAAVSVRLRSGQLPWRAVVRSVRQYLDRGAVQAGGLEQGGEHFGGPFGLIEGE